MAEFKDMIPMGNDNDSNSGDSWFVLSSASEEEEEESMDTVEQPANFHKDIAEKNEYESADEPNLQQLENSLKEKDRNKENDPVDKEPKMDQLTDFQKEISNEKINDPVDKEPKLDQLDNFQKEMSDEKLNSEKRKMPIKQEVETVHEERNEKLEMIEDKQEKQMEEKALEKLKEGIEKEQKTNNLEHRDPVVTEYVNIQKETVLTETEKAIITKNRRKSKGLLVDEESHNEIALEVHALRETLIQLSLNLSNSEEEKYSAITSEVQALREIVSQLNNDLSNRVSQIETRTEQVHTLLCRFIMTRCGNYKEPITHVVNTVKEQRPNTSDMAVQTEGLEIMQIPVSVLSENSTVPSDQVEPQHTNENKEATSVVNTSSHLSRMDDAKTSHTDKEQPDNHGLKRPRSDGESSHVSKEPSHCSEISEESTYLLPTPAKRHEPSKFSNEKPYHNRHKPRFSKLSTENYHNFRESFHQYPSTHQTPTYSSNRELAELAFRYSSENAKHWRKTRSNRPWQSGNDRKHPYSKQTQEGHDIHSSDTEMDKPPGEFPPELDDYMDKVIDEWAQDEDD